MNWYLKVLKQYADFNGRARRKEYWMFVLFNILAVIVAMVLDTLLGLSFIPPEMPVYGFLYLTYMIAVLIPTLAVSVRRLHDIGKSGWMMLVGLIPFIGGIWLFVLTLLDSEAGINRYGENPKGVE